MKKILVMLVTVAVAGMAVADLSVDFKSGGVPILKQGEVAPGPTTLLEAGSLVQLVWRSTADAVANYQVARQLDISLVDAGDFVLASVAGGAGAIWADGADIFTNADVGGANINDGYFFARVFETTGVAGDYVLEVGLQGTPLNVFSALDPSSTYAQNMNGLGIVAIDSQSIQVIPEPATFGLLGVAGLGMFLARKKARR